MPGRGTERVLWGVIYAVLALAPVAFLAAAPGTEDSDDVLLAVAIGFVAADRAGAAGRDREPRPSRRRSASTG